MPRNTIKLLLEKKIGLSEEIIGSRIIDKALQERMSVVGITDAGEYLDYISKHQEEMEELVEVLVVPETWFFRNETSFSFLGNHVKSKWLPSHGESILRILSIPCSTGEEPCSIVMTLADKGIFKPHFNIDAVDISRKALHQAETGLYGSMSFRGKDMEFRTRYFKKEKNFYKINQDIRDSIRFLKGNLLDDNLLANARPYDIIFCRNLLIYLSDSAKKQAVKVICRLLAPDGILFLGHAEHEPFRDSGFDWISPHRAFACQRTALPGVNDIPPPQQYAKKKKSKDTPNIIKSAAKPLPAIPKPRLELPVIPVKNSIFSNDAEELLNAAREMADRGALDEAFKKCRAFLDEHPAHANAHYLMGMMYQSVGNDKDSETFLNKCLYLDPAHCDALEQLALIAEHRGDYAEAEHLRRRIRRILERGEKS